MSFIDLNSQEFESRSARPFNDGKAGIVEVTIDSVEKDVEKGRWVITYKDEAGGTLRDFYSYIDQSDKDITKRIQAQGRTLRHVWTESVGEIPLPPFRNTTEMLDVIMTTVKGSCKGKKFRIVVDYGSRDRHSAYLNRKRLVPFIELATEEPSKLFMIRDAYTTPAAPTRMEDMMGPSLTDAPSTEKRETIDDWLKDN